MIIDGVGILFRWGEVEEWIVLITMSIPPVWPLFRPLTHHFIRSTANLSQPQYKQNGYYGNYGSTTRGNQSSAPPIVTTTISISSQKGAAATATTAARLLRQTRFRDLGRRPETPHTILSHNGDPEGWVEMSHFKEQNRT